MCGGVFSRSQTHTFFFGQVILMHTRYGSEDLLTTIRRDGALQILPRGAHHDRPGRFPRAPPAHLASPHPRPRGTPCTCSSRAGARTGPLHPHSLQRLLLHLCSQMLGPAHSRQSLRMRWWSQMLPPPHSLHRLLTCWCCQRPRPPHSLYTLLTRRGGQMLEPPHSLHRFLWRCSMLCPSHACRFLAVLARLDF